jgi:hypothetical protein
MNDRRVRGENMKKVGVVVLSAMVACCAAAQEEEQQAKPIPIPAAVKARLSKLLPELAPGVTAQPAQFYSSNLYQYIDGGAEAFHMYGMVAMVHQEFHVGKAEITVDVYDMGDPLRAFGIYTAERSPEYHFIDMGAEGYVSEDLLNFLQGNYYVKLSAFAERDSAAGMLENVGREISRKVGSGRAMPQAVASFPPNELVERSQKYIMQSPLGHDFLAPAATAEYRLQGKETTVLFSLARTPADAALRVERLRQSFATSGKVAAFDGIPAEAWRGSNSYEGDMIFFASGRYAVVVVGPPPEPEVFLKEVLASIKE